MQKECLTAGAGATGTKRARSCVDNDSAAWLLKTRRLSPPPSPSPPPSSSSSQQQQQQRQRRQPQGRRFQLAQLFQEDPSDGSLLLTTLGLRLKPCEDAAEQFAQELLAVRLLVDSLEDRYANCVAPRVRHQRPELRRLLELAIRCWFDSNFRVIEKQDGGGAAVAAGKAFSRHELLASLNEFLSRLDLGPPLRNKDDAWCRFFLRGMLNLSERECRSGKDLRLEDRRSLASMLNAAQSFYEELVGYGGLDFALQQQQQ